MNNPLLGVISNDLRAIGLSLLLTTECEEKEIITNGEEDLKHEPHCRNRNVLDDICHLLPEHLQSKQSLNLKF